MLRTCRALIVVLVLCLTLGASTAPPAAILARPAPPVVTGWTSIPAAGNTRYVYVSSSTGSDGAGYTGSITRPFATLNKAITDPTHGLRDGYADWLLLKCGDTWNSESFTGWNLSGAAANAKMRIMSYGTGPRPIISCSGWTSGFYQAAATPISHLAITDIAFVSSHTTQLPRGIAFDYKSEDILIEGCYIEKFRENILFDANSNSNLHTTISIRRNVIVDSFANDGCPVAPCSPIVDNANSQGIYCAGVNHLTIEENYLLNNGWPAAPSPYNNGKSHNAYIQWDSAARGQCTDVTFSSNFATDSDGVQLRGGGTIEYNVVVFTIFLPL